MAKHKTHKDRRNNVTADHKSHVLAKQQLAKRDARDARRDARTGSAR